MVTISAHYLKGGAAGVVPKPFDPVTLPTEILRILGSPALEWSAQRNPPSGLVSDQSP
jgi:hypothetical protein